MSNIPKSKSTHKMRNFLKKLYTKCRGETSKLDHLLLSHIKIFKIKKRSGTNYPDSFSS